MQSENVSKLVDDILRVADKDQVDALVSQLVSRLVFSLSRAETALVEIRKTIKDHLGEEEVILNDIEWVAREAIKDLNFELFGE